MGPLVGGNELRERGVRNVNIITSRLPSSSSSSSSSRRFRVGRVRVAPKTTPMVLWSIPNEENLQSQNNCQCHLHCINHRTTSAREQESKTSPPCHATFKYLIPLLLALLAVKYQGKPVNPFETHPATMWTFFISTCIYCLALGLLKELHNNIGRPTCSRILDILGYIVIISGALSSVSVGSIFLPHLLGKLIFVVWAFLPLILARNFFILAICGTRQRMVNAIAWVRDKSSQSAGRNSIEEPSLPT